MEKLKNFVLRRVRHSWSKKHKYIIFEEHINGDKHYYEMNGVKIASVIKKEK